jgi:hypothetical protein
MSIPEIRRRLQHQIDLEADVLKQLLDPPALLRGSVSQVLTRCGKPNCWCAQSADGHRHARVSWSHHGKLLTRKIAPDQVGVAQELSAHYRQLRRQRRKLATVQTRMKTLLDQLEEALSDQARKRLGISSSTAKMSAKH